MLAKELRKHLQSGKLDPIYLIHGEENYFSDESVRLLIDQVVQEEDRSFLVGHFDLEEGDLSSALAQARTVPFFMKTQVVLIQVGNKLSAEETERLVSYAQNPSPDTIFILKSDKLDFGKKAYLELRKNCTEIKCDVLKGRELAKWVTGRSKSLGGKFSDEAALQLVELIGPNLQRMESEIHKVSLFYKDKETVLPEDVCEVVAEIPMDTIFELMDALGRKKTAKATTLLGRLLISGSEPLAILGMIARQFRLLWQVRFLDGKGMKSQEISKATGIHPGFQNEYLRQSKMFSSRELKGSLLYVQRADLTLKSTDIPDQMVLEKLIFDLTIRTSGEVTSLK